MPVSASVTMPAVLSAAGSRRATLLLPPRPVQWNADRAKSAGRIRQRHADRHGRRQTAQDACLPYRAVAQPQGLKRSDVHLTHGRLPRGDVLFNRTEPERRPH